MFWQNFTGNSKNLTCSLYECQQDTFLIDFVNDLEKPPKFQPHFFHRIHGFIHKLLSKKDGIMIAPHFFSEKFTVSCQTKTILKKSQSKFENVWSKVTECKILSTISSACVNIYHVIEGRTSLSTRSWGASSLPQKRRALFIITSCFNSAPIGESQICVYKLSQYLISYFWKQCYQLIKYFYNIINLARVVNFRFKLRANTESSQSQLSFTL